MMLSIGKNDDFTFNSLLKSNTKYLFSFEFDLCYDEFDEAIARAGQANDEQAFIDAYNAYEERNGIPDKIIKIISIVGMNGGWPEVIIQTTKPMTVKEYAEYLGFVYDYGGGGFTTVIDRLRDEGITVVKICE